MLCTASCGARKAGGGGGVCVCGWLPREQGRPAQAGMVDNDVHALLACLLPRLYAWSLRRCGSVCLPPSGGAFHFAPVSRSTPATANAEGFILRQLPASLFIACLACTLRASTVPVQQVHRACTAISFSAQCWYGRDCKLDGFLLNGDLTTGTAGTAGACTS